MTIELVLDFKETEDPLENYLALCKVMLTLHPLGQCIGYHIEENKVIIILEREAGVFERDIKSLTALIRPHELISITDVNITHNHDTRNISVMKINQGKITSFDINVGQTFTNAFNFLLNNSKSPPGLSIEKTIKQLSIEQLHSFTRNGDSHVVWLPQRTDNADMAGAFIQMPFIITPEESPLLKTDYCFAKFSEILTKMLPDTKEVKIVANDRLQLKIKIAPNELSVYDIERSIRAALLLSGLHQTIEPASMLLINQPAINFEQACRIGMAYYDEDQILLTMHYYKIAVNYENASLHPAYLELVLTLADLYYKKSGLLDGYTADTGMIESANKHYTKAKKIMLNPPASYTLEYTTKTQTEINTRIACCTSYLDQRVQSLKDSKARFGFLATSAASQVTLSTAGVEGDMGDAYHHTPKEEQTRRRYRLFKHVHLPKLPKRFRKRPDPRKDPTFGSDM